MADEPRTGSERTSLAAAAEALRDALQAAYAPAGPRMPRTSGARAAEAIAEFQRRAGLVETGDFDTSTAAALDEVGFEGSAAAPAPAEPDATRELVVDVSGEVEPGATVRAFRRVDGREVPLGAVPVSRRGRARFRWTDAASADGDAQLRFELVAGDRQVGEDERTVARRTASVEIAAGAPAAAPPDGVPALAEALGVSATRAERAVAALGVRGPEELATSDPAAIAALPRADRDAADRLRRGADLLAVAGTPEVAAAMVELDLPGAEHVADVEALVDRLEPEVGREAAIAVGARAVAYAATLDAVSLTRQLEGRPISQQDRALAAPTDACDCVACRAVASPLAYLADLLDYVLDRMRDGSATLTLTWLESRLHQPFRGLPAACALVERQVARLRIVVEVLRADLAAGPAPDAAAAAALAEQEVRYARSAYAAVLESLGVSPVELIAARGAAAADRAAVAERLGIEVDPAGPRPDRLDQLVPGNLTEAWLEQTFGLRSTRRDPLTDPPAGALGTWRAEALRAGWRRADLAAPVFGGTRPVIDPDVIGPEDFRDPTAGVPAFDLWTARRAWVDNAVNAISDAYDQGDLEDAANTAFGGTVTFAHLRALHAHLTAEDDGTDALPELEQLGISVEALAELDRAADALAADPTSTADRDAVAAILAAAMKFAQRSQWLAAEQAAGVFLTQATFWPALAEPEPAPWLGDAEGRALWRRELDEAAGPVVIDPDLIGAAEVVDPGLTNPVWTERMDRATELEFRASELAALRAAAPDDATALEACLLDALSIDLADLEDLRLQEETGGDATRRLAQLNVGRSAYRRLLEVAALVAAGQPADDEWPDVDAILLGVYKQRAAAQWRRQERAAGFFLDPAVFRATRSTEPAPVSEWRAPMAARRAWADTLEARAAQEQTLRDGLDAALLTAEERSLGILRDAVVAASTPPGASAAERADALGSRLGIDVRTAGCERTTRVAAALEALQALVFGIRTGQLHDAYPQLTLTAADFDEEWSWMGSFSTWRAAMLVFVFPENLLHPGLRRNRTPAFSQLQSELRGGTRMSAARVRQAVDRFAGYLADVLSLRLEATCMATPRATGQTLRHTYFFGRGGSSGLVYWSSTWDQQDGLDHAHNQWAALPQLGAVSQIVGAIPWVASSDERWVVLLVKQRSRDRDTLATLRYDLQQRRWDDAPAPLKIPEGIDSFTAAARQGDGERTPPQVALKATGGGIVTRALGRDATDWEDGEWQTIEGPGQAARLGTLQAFLDLGGGTTALVADSPAGGCAYRVLGPRDDGTWSPLGASGTYRGGIVWGATDNYATVFVGGPTGGRWIYRLQPDGPLGWRSLNTFDGVSAWLLAISGLSLDSLILRQGFTSRNEHVGRSLLSVLKAGGLSVLEISLYGAMPRLMAEEDTPAGRAWRGAIEAAARFSSGNEPLESILIRLSWGSATVSVRDRARAWEANGGYDDTNFAGTTIVPHAGGDFSSPPAWTLFGFRENDGPPFRGRIERSFFGGLTLMTRSRIAPPPGAPPDVPERLTDDRRPNRIAAVRSAIQQTSTSPRNRVLVEEAYYFVPMLAGMTLGPRGQFDAALDWFRTVYDYGAPAAERKVYYGLVTESAGVPDLTRAADWLLDPLDPHAIAATRPRSYTRFTIYQIASTLIAFANAEFTIDSAESRPRARYLYGTALRVLAAPELRPDRPGCRELLQDFTIRVGEEEPGVLRPLQAELATITSPSRLKRAASAVRRALATAGTDAERYERAHRAVVRAREQDDGPAPTFEALLDERRSTGSAARTALARQARPRQLAATAAGGWADGGNSLIVLRRPRPAPVFGFCIPPNPVWDGLRMQAELNLFKLRTCRNIAGLERPTEPYAGPIDTLAELPTLDGGGQIRLPGSRAPRPSPYRYAAVIERAKQLATLAGQAEAQMLSALEKRDAEFYNLMRARQDLQSARGTVRLQDLRVKEAEGGVRVAELQQRRAEGEVSYYSDLLVEGLSALEYAGIASMQIAAVLGVVAASFQFSAAGIQAGVAAGKMAATYGIEGWSDLAAGLASTAGGFSALAGAAANQSSVLQTLASFERRAQEWEHARNLAASDVAISSEQVRIAETRVQIAGQERTLAQLGVDHADASVEFLANKFTNVELYDWMSGVLEQVYASLLEQATATARLAAEQLAFERQEQPPPFVHDSYWEPDTDAPAQDGADGAQVDRRGLTGSARLLRDISQLDGWAFDTARRRLQVSRTFSLAQLAPIDFQRFRDTGTLNFRIPAEVLDREFPDQYLRMVARVRVSVVALVPPAVGIRATLSNTAVSRIVLGPPDFQAVTVRGESQTIAFTSPKEASGIFELDPQADMLLPFEGVGVDDSSWQLNLPRRSNPIDHQSIADVLFTVDYTALANPGRRDVALAALPSTLRGERAFSIRQQLPDQWWELHNPDQSATPMTIEFSITDDDFPRNLAGPRIEQVALYLARDPGLVDDLQVTRLALQGLPGGWVGGSARTAGGLASTRTGNAPSWTTLIGRSPVGTWRLQLPDTVAVRQLFQDERLRDVLLVIAVRADVPAS
jgi:hypothetical protein